MSEGSKDNRLVELEITDRWVAGKSEEELLNSLKVYLARLRDNPRSIPDRLRVAAIQLKLGRMPEAMIHYEGVLRGYVENDQILNAITLCKRILGHNSELPRIKRFLAALYARAPRGATGAPAAVTPIPLEDRPTTSFVVDNSEEIEIEEEESTERNVVVDRIFPDIETGVRLRPPTGRLHVKEEQRPTRPYEQPPRPRKPGSTSWNEAQTVSMDQIKTVIAGPNDLPLEAQITESGPHLLTTPKALEEPTELEPSHDGPAPLAVPGRPRIPTPREPKLPAPRQPRRSASRRNDSAEALPATELEPALYDDQEPPPIPDEPLPPPGSGPRSRNMPGPAPKPPPEPQPPLHTAGEEDGQDGTVILLTKKKKKKK